jgi:tetratricopeptide (TPR) repeat protein
MNRLIIQLSILAFLITSCQIKENYHGLIEKATQEELKQNYSAAKRLYIMAIELKPNTAKTYSLLAGVMVQTCFDCDSVTLLLDKAFSIDSTEKTTLFNLAYVNGRIRNDYANSINFYSKLISLTDSEDTIAMLKANRANMFLRLSDTTQYCNDLKEALEIIDNEQLRNNYLINCSDYIETDMDIEVRLDSTNNVDTLIFK